DNLRYVKADVALKVRSNQSILMAVESHLPRIKHQLLMLLARQELEGITSADGRQALKEQARDDILDILSEEGIDANIEEVLFTGFLVE
ncbi:MAG: flagellar basal body-associated FliL family protein, partial [Gammaproteobacteria bacterium]